MAMFSRRPASLAHLSDEAAARALSKHFGDFVKAAKELGVDRKALSRLSWSNPAILSAARERMDLFIFLQRDEIISGLNSRIASVRRRAVDRMLAHPMMYDHPLLAVCRCSRQLRVLAVLIVGSRMGGRPPSSGRRWLRGNGKPQLSESGKRRLSGSWSWSGSKSWSSAARLSWRRRRLRACGRRTFVVRLGGVAGSGSLAMSFCNLRDFLTVRFNLAVVTRNRLAAATTSPFSKNSAVAASSWSIGSESGLSS